MFKFYSSESESVWSGHSRWLFSHSLSLPCSTSTCFTYILLTRLTFPRTRPRPQLVIVLIKGAVRSKPPSWDSLVTNEPSQSVSSVAQSCPTLCNPINHRTSGLPVHHQLPEFTQTHVHRVGDAIQPSHPLSSPSPPAPNPSQHQGLFQ